MYSKTFLTGTAEDLVNTSRNTGRSGHPRLGMQNLKGQPPVWQIDALKEVLEDASLS